MILDPQTPVGQLVAEHPARARVFDRIGIDYCCEGQISLAEACTGSRLHLCEVLHQLHACDDVEAERSHADRSWPTLGALIDHIRLENHASLRPELSRLADLAERVASAHGVRHPNLVGVCSELREFKAELESHLDREEQIVFPALQRLDEARDLPRDGAGSIGVPIESLECEHWMIADALGRLRALTDGYTTPQDSDITCHMLMEGLAALDVALRHTVHEENNLLYYKARATEAALQSDRNRPARDDLRRS